MLSRFRRSSVMLFRLLSARAAASPQAAPNPITGNHGVLGQIELSDRGGMRGDEPAEAELKWRLMAVRTCMQGAPGSTGPRHGQNTRGR